MAGSDEGGAHEAVEPTAQHSQSRLLAVVGFDGSEPAYRALDAATRLISGRPGTIEVVYVAHQPFGTEMSADAGLEMMKGFDAAEHEFAEAVRSRMEGVEERWHFQRRDGAIAHELALVAEQLERDYGEGATVVVVVGSAVHSYHHVLGSVPVALVRHANFAVVVVP